MDCGDIFVKIIGHVQSIGLLLTVWALLEVMVTKRELRELRKEIKNQKDGNTKKSD